MKFKLIVEVDPAYDSPEGFLKEALTAQVDEEDVSIHIAGESFHVAILRVSEEP